MVGWRPEWGERDGRSWRVELAAGPSTAPLAMRPRETSLRMTVLLKLRTTVCGGRERAHISEARCGAPGESAVQSDGTGMVGWRSEWGERDGRSWRVELAAGPSTAPLAMRLRETSLRMTVLLKLRTTVCGGRERTHISEARCGAPVPEPSQSPSSSVAAHPHLRSEMWGTRRLKDRYGDSDSASQNDGDWWSGGWYSRRHGA